MATKANTGKRNDVERDLLEGLSEFSDALASGKKIGERFTCRQVTLDLKPQTYTPQKVKFVRDLLGVSQGLFAQFLGVSVKTVRAWELGTDPSVMACRFMDEIQLAPEHWKKRLRQVTIAKTSLGKVRVKSSK